MKGYILETTGVVRFWESCWERDLHNDGRAEKCIKRVSMTKVRKPQYKQRTRTQGERTYKRNVQSLLLFQLVKLFISSEQRKLQ
jgi:hypothetical protein